MKKATTLVVLSALFAAASSVYAVAPAYDFYSPAGWSAGSTYSTYQEWGANPGVGMDGAPNVASNTAGATLASPTLGVTGGFTAGSGGYYAFAGNYAVTARVKNHTAAVGTDLGTHVIVQAYSSLNPDVPHSLLGVSIVDPNGVAIPGTQVVQTSYYGYAENVPSSFGLVSVEAGIFEFWLPNYTGDFSAVINNQVHSSFQGVQVDTKVASAVTGGSPFGATVVPEPAAIAVAGLAAVGLLARRRAH